MAKGISASTIKSWFQYNCERRTRYELMDRTALDAVPVLQDGRGDAWADLGLTFERAVVAALGRKHVVAPANGASSVSDAATIAFLSGRRLEPYIHQIDLKPHVRPDFLDRVPDVTPRSTRADLIRVNRSGDVPSFTVIDVKAARRATSFHKAQVAYYALLLEARLRELGVGATLDESGEIWRIPDDGTASGSEHQSERFPLAPYLRIVRKFCSEDLPRIAAKRVEPGRDETFFHLYFKCEQCTYLAHCLAAVAPERPATKKDVSAVAGLTHEAKRSLHRLNVRTVSDLAAAKGLAQAADLGWSLKRRAPTLLARARALSEGRVLRTEEAHSFLMPPRFDVAIHLIADFDPVDDGLATLGCLVVRDGEEQLLVRVLDTPDRSHEAEALVEIFGAVLAALGAVDRHNAALAETGELASGLHAHIFIYEAAEARSIQDAVKRHLADSRVRLGLLNMVRLFPPEDVVPEPEFRGMHHLPATALRSVVEQLFALPALVSYDLRQVSRALQDAGKVTVAYDPDEPFARPFSSLLSIAVSRDLREGRDGAPSRDEVAADVTARLRASRAVAEWLRGEDTAQRATGGGPLLRLAKRPFRFQASFDPLAASDLDVLQAFELIENRAGLLERLVALAKPATRRRDNGEAMTGLDLLRHELKGGSAHLRLRVPPESRDSDLSPDSFSLVITDGDVGALLDPTAWASVACSILPPRDGELDRGFITVRMHRTAYHSELFQGMLRRSVGERGAWVLDRSFADPNTPRIAAFLGHLAAGAGSAQNGEAGQTVAVKVGQGA